MPIFQEPLPAIPPGLGGSPSTASPVQPPTNPSLTLGGLMALLTSAANPLGTHGITTLAQQFSGTAPGISGMPGAGGVPAAGAEKRQANNPDNPWIYMGVKEDGGYHIGGGGEEYFYDTEKKRRLSALMSKYEGWDIAEKRRMYRLILMAGLDGYEPVDLTEVDEEVAGATLTQMTDAYLNLLGVSAAYYARGRLMTPEEVLSEHLGARLAGYGVPWDGSLDAFDKGLAKSDALREAMENGTAAQSLAPLKPFTQTTTSRSVDIMDPMDAKALTRAMLQQELGRDPTQAEYEDFISAIQAAERQNPTTTKTTTRYGVERQGGDESYYVKNANTVTHQGIGAEGIAQMAYEKAQRQPGWAEWQAVGTYAPALFAALGAPIEGV